MDTLKQKFNSIAQGETAQKFEKYYELLIEWNNKFNLTAITEREEVYLKHFADSIAAADMLKGKVLDIGAGAGFPSIPLKIVRSDLEIVMADSLLKRVGFLNEVVKSLDLKGIEAVHTRVEDIKEKEHFDFAVARAVAPMRTLAEYMLPFVKEGGQAIAYKSENVDEELSEAENAIKKLGGAKPEVIRFNLSEDTVRTLVVIKKIKHTPMRFPRGKNLPRKQPL